ncbi:hypothetical protein RRG08_040757 [Elysia crispata]|uniref:Uncharacterized protein n=1 Tax=Elysia crispata TaxID=231223 RepID=A0AAE1BE75_9GAST|nr:hypothetical protein RRG08_040757 [Elysia crispata]
MTLDLECIQIPMTCSLDVDAISTNVTRETFPPQTLNSITFLTGDSGRSMTMRRFGTLGSLTKFLLDLNIYGDGDSRICKVHATTGSVSHPTPELTMVLSLALTWEHIPSSIASFPHMGALNTRDHRVQPRLMRARWDSVGFANHLLHDHLARWSSDKVPSSVTDHTHRHGNTLTVTENTLTVTENTLTVTENILTVTENTLNVTEIHSPSRKTHSPSRKTHSPSRKTHTTSRKTHSPSRKTHSPSRKTHSPSRKTHSPSRKQR